MKMFFKHIVIFMGVALVALFIFEFSTTSWLASKANFKLPEQKSMIVLGHSHPECAYNDSIIHDFKNLARSGEAYFYTYPKIQELLKQNESLKIIFLEFTNNQIDENMNRWTWGEKHMLQNYPRFTSFMSTSDKAFLARKNPAAFFKSFALSSKNRAKRMSLGNYSYVNDLGGYLYLKRDKTDSLVALMRNKSKDLNLEKDIIVQRKHLNFLRRIIEEAKSRIRGLF